jgi:hypothetical protein
LKALFSPSIVANMSNLAVRLASARKTAATLRAENSALESQALSHVVAMGGGVLGALAHQYLPGMVPGTAGDGPALLASTLVLDGIAMYSGSPEVLALAYGYEGKVLGDAFEVAMGWRPSVEKA